MTAIPQESRLELPGKKGIVRYTIGEDGEIMRQMPNGSISFSDEWLESMRDMRDHDRAGYEVLIDGEPLIPKTGFLGWLHSLVDRLEAWRKRK